MQNIRGGEIPKASGTLFVKNTMEHEQQKWDNFFVRDVCPKITST
jgi:hypothetical protein